MVKLRRELMVSPRSFSPFTLSRFSLAALATALLWWLSLQHLGWFALGWIAFVPLFAVLSTLPAARARFWFGWRAGLLSFALINWWVLPAIIKGGAIIGASAPASAALGVLAVLLIGLIHGLGIAIIALLWNPRAKFFKTSPLLFPVFIALLWYLFEAARASGVLAHSWGAPAFSQWRDTALLQSAHFLGQHGLSALCVWFAASFALWLQPEYSARVPGLWRAPLTVFLLLHVWGAWRIFTYDAARSDARHLEVLLVQTDVSSLRKSRDGGESHFDQAERLTREYFRSGEKADLIVWPETTAELIKSMQGDVETPGPFDDTPSRHASRATNLAAQLHTPLLCGAQVNQAWVGGVPPRLSNRAVLFSPDGALPQSSSKTRVVPFGERAPFGEYLPFLNKLAPEPPVVPATSATTLQLRDFSIGTLICFESCFSTPAKTLKARGAQALFVLTNDEWFAGTTAPWEHAAMSTLRAVENDVPVAQCGNGGYSFVVDARGRFMALSTSGEVQVLAAQMELR
jgi:apolipoprotein N-acyltransferase